MKPLGKVVAGAVVSAFVALAPVVSSAHSASDAYLTLTAPAQPAAGSLHGQLDVALRDLDFVLKLDDDGDGNITWDELRRHQVEIAGYVSKGLAFGADGRACRLEIDKQMVDNHADGAYAALFFEVDCGGAASRVTLDYRLFFSVDPSHRAIVVAHTGNDTATALLSPDKARIELRLTAARAGNPGR